MKDQTEKKKFEKHKKVHDTHQIGDMAEWQIKSQRQSRENEEIFRKDHNL